jgi:hypothetical protein
MFSQIVLPQTLCDSQILSDVILKPNSQNVILRINVLKPWFWNPHPQTPILWITFGHAAILKTSSTNPNSFSNFEHLKRWFSILKRHQNFKGLIIIFFYMGLFSFPGFFARWIRLFAAMSYIFFLDFFLWFFVIYGFICSLIFDKTKICSLLYMGTLNIFMVNLWKGILEC